MDERRKILRNIVRCTRCNDTIESKHRHDFVACKCDAVFVDGGRAYVRVGFREDGDAEILTEYEPAATSGV